MNYLKHYKETKKQGWKLDEYKAAITLQYNNSKVRIDFVGDYFALLSTIARYKSFNMASEWHVLKNGVEVSPDELFTYFEEAESL